MAMLERLANPPLPGRATVENASVSPRPAREDDFDEFDDALVEMLHPDIVVESHPGRQKVYRPKVSPQRP
jgi:hypothetical protein